MPEPIELAGEVNRYTYVAGDPLNYTDSSGLLIDVLADLGFIAYDLYALVRDGSCNLSENLTALGLDIAGAVVPGEI